MFLVSKFTKFRVFPLTEQADKEDDSVSVQGREQGTRKVSEFTPSASN